VTEVALAEEIRVLRSLVDRQEGLWLQRLAALDARGAAGADQGQQFGSTAGWLRARLRLGAGAATTAVRTARALFRGPLSETAQALTDGEISAAHASAVVHGTRDLPDHLATDADRVLVEAARTLDPRRLRQVAAHLRQVADPDGADAAAQRRHARRGLWLTPTFDQLVAVDGLLEPEAGQLVQAALEPLARPADANDHRSGSQRTADALTELARRALEGGGLPVTGGVRPQLSVVVDLDSLLGHPGAIGGDLGGFGPLEPEACRRLACDGALTRVVVTRQPGGHHPPTGKPTGPDDHTDNASSQAGPGGCACPDAGPGIDPSRAKQAPGVAGWLQAALTRLPRILGGAPSQPLDVGRTSRTITPAQRHALAVRDGGCVFPGCSRPLVWCEGHHLVHWLDGGPTDLANLVLLCRAHHRAVHEGGWRLARGPDGGVTATPPHRRHPSARRHPPAA
jgi:hypothetical protein